MTNSKLAHFMINTQYGSDVDRECLLLQPDGNAVDKLFVLLAEWSILKTHLNNIAELEHCSRKEACEELLQRCSELEQKLHVAWLNGPALGLHENLSLSCRDGEWLDSGSRSRLDPFSYEFENLNTAKTCLLYWMISLVTSRLIYEGATLLQRHCDSAQMVSFANNLLCSVSYCMQRDRQMSSLHVVLFILKQTSKCYIIFGKKEEFERCQEIYRLITLCGFHMAAHMAEENLADWHASQKQPVTNNLTVASRR